jgi:hypothetical protein
MDTSAKGPAAGLNLEANKQFSEIWNHAVLQYKINTNRDSLQLVKNRDWDSTEQFYTFLNDRGDQRQKAREKHQRTRDILQSCVTPIRGLGEVLKSSLSLTPFAPAATIFGAGMFLLDACEGVSQAYDCVAELFDACQEFAKRIQQYFTTEIEDYQLKKITSILCFLLEVFAQCEQIISKPRTKMLWAVISGRKNEMLRKKVDELNKQFEYEEKFSISAIISTVRDMDKRQKEASSKQREEELQKGIESMPLGPIDIASKQADEVRKAENCPPEWIHTETVFKQWLAGTTRDERWLWVIGDQGAGKTSLVSYLTWNWMLASQQVLDSNGASGHEVQGLPGEAKYCLRRKAVALFFCSYRHGDGQKPDAVFQSLCRQLLQQLHIFDPKRAHIRMNQINPPADKITSVVNWTSTLDNLTSEFQEAFVVIDALDENETGYVELISRLAQLRSPSVKLLLTSRIDRSTKPGLQGFPSLQLSIHAKDELIKAYVDARLTRIANDEKIIGGDALATTLRNNGQQDICNRIVQAAVGNFYYAELQISTLKAEATTEGIKSSLGHLAANNLTNVIRSAIDRIKEQEDRHKREIGMNTLMWSIYAGRDLTMEELRYAVALSIRPYTREDDEGLHREIVRLSQETLLDASRHFFRIDREKSLVHVHEPIKDYCDQANVFEDAHYHMAETCLTFLDQRSFPLRSASKEEFEYRKRLNPFYDYAAQHWGFHMKKAGEKRFLGPSSPVSMLSLLNRRLFLNCVAVSLHERLQRIRMWRWQNVDSWDLLGDTSRPVVSAVHLLTYFDLHHTLDWWLRQRPRDVNHRSQTHTTPLYMACCLKRIRVADTLLFDFNADPAEKGAAPSGFN